MTTELTGRDLMTREQALQTLFDREGVEPYTIEHHTDEVIITAAQAPAGQPCSDCGQLVVWDEADFDWHHVETPTGCFLARRDER